jgi:tRNA pseudouridine55 synthase
MRMDGLLVVDKPEGITSLDVVREVKRRFSVKKAGHIGTLDPFATGVLPVVLNEGTKLVPFLEEGPKEYEAVIKLGEETTTDDLTGEILLKKSWEGVTAESIQTVFQAFLGKIQQIPPMFSAVKIDGKPLYRWARKGIEIDRKEREVEIFALQIEKVAFPLVHFRVSCTKGTYVRTLGKDIGRRIGCGAHLFRLKRIRSGSFTMEQAVPWERLKGFRGAESLSPWLISLTEALGSFPEVIGDERLLERVRSGREVVARDLFSQALPSFDEGVWVKIVSSFGGLVALSNSVVKSSDVRLGDPERVVLRPVRIFHPSQQGHSKGYS